MVACIFQSTKTKLNVKLLKVVKDYHNAEFDMTLILVLQLFTKYESQKWYLMQFPVILSPENISCSNKGNP